MKIKINNRFFEHFNDLNISFSLDTFASVFSFKARFNPNNKVYREIFKPLTYPKVEIFTNNDELLLTGNIVNNSFSSSNNPELISVGGYSKSGILEDVAIPLDVYPLEKNNKSLNEISSELISRFNINQVIDESVTNEANSNYEKVTAQPTESIAAFLTKLAAQKNIIIGHNNNGDIKYFNLKSKSSKPKRFYSKSNVLKSKIAINGRGLHSSISVLRQPSDDNSGVSTLDTVSNNIVGQKRDVIKTLSSGTEVDTTRAANNILASELKSLALSINLPKIDFDLKCGDVIEFQNNELFIFKKQKFIISKINYKESSNNNSMNMTCLLPEAFSGENPKNIFEL